MISPMLVIPEKYNRNSSTVTALMPPEESGLWLLERMRQRIGFETYADKHLLDFGCGARFTQAIVNSGMRIGGYAGIDNFKGMIDFLRNSVFDPRFSFYFLNARHSLYNPAGKPMTQDTRLPLAEQAFDIVSMFSVITHQNPSDSESLFKILRRHIKPTGHLFFTCFLDNQIETFEDRSPERNGGRCFYNESYLTNLVETCGWRKVSSAAAEAPLIGDSFVYRPV